MSQKMVLLGLLPNQQCMDSVVSGLKTLHQKETPMTHVTLSQFLSLFRPNRYSVQLMKVMSKRVRQDISSRKCNQGKG